MGNKKRLLNDFEVIKQPFSTDYYILFFVANVPPPFRVINFLTIFHVKMVGKRIGQIPQPLCTSGLSDLSLLYHDGTARLRCSYSVA
jgi:hypothetical protein